MNKYFIRYVCLCVSLDSDTHYKERTDGRIKFVLVPKCSNFQKEKVVRFWVIQSYQHILLRVPFLIYIWYISHRFGNSIIRSGQQLGGRRKFFFIFLSLSPSTPGCRSHPSVSILCAGFQLLTSNFSPGFGCHCFETRHSFHLMKGVGKKSPRLQGGLMTEEKRIDGE